MTKCIFYIQDLISQKNWCYSLKVSRRVKQFLQVSINIKRNQNQLEKVKMKHKMNLHSEPFDLIQSGYKTIELRLNDEKRSMIHCGDIIEFTNTSNPNKRIEVKVLKIHHFDSFYRLLPSSFSSFSETGKGKERYGRFRRSASDHCRIESTFKRRQCR